MRCARRSSLILLLAPVFLLSCKSDRDVPTHKIRPDDKEIHRAMQTAKKDLIKLFEAVLKGVDSYSVKAPFSDDNGTEHFWLSEVTYENGIFTGKINNDPITVKSVKLGQEVQVKEEEISDWLYVRNGRVTGNYTLRAILKRMPKAEAEQAKRAMGWD